MTERKHKLDIVTAAYLAMQIAIASRFVTYMHKNLAVKSHLLHLDMQLEL